MSSIVTFYSYKGGVGRSMALANIAFELAKRNKKVLIVDWDLEAPGLERYFDKFEINKNSEGLLQLLIEFRNNKVANHKDYLSTVFTTFSHPIYLLHSGREKDPAKYSADLETFKWDNFFRPNGGGRHLEDLRNQWRKEFDVVLIDSRTGLSDASGVCTIMLPDIIIPMFTANYQSLFGIRDIMNFIQSARQRLSVDRMSLTILPLPARFGTRVEFKESQEWLDRIADILKDCFSDWLPKWIEPRYVLEQIKIPQVDYFSFGEKLAVVEQGTNDPESMGFIYAKLADFLASDFTDIESFIGKHYYNERKSAYQRQRAALITEERKEEKYKFDLFISYPRSVYQWVREVMLPALSEYLEDELGYHPSIFYEASELIPGNNWSDSMKIALEKSKTFLFVFSDRESKSEFISNELLFAESAEKAAKKNIIFRVLFTKAHSSIDITPILLERQTVDLSPFSIEAINSSTKLNAQFGNIIEKLSAAIAGSIRTINNAHLDPINVKSQIQLELESLAEAYENIRGKMPSSKSRTRLMQDVVEKMKAKASEAEFLLPSLMNSSSPGKRLAAIAILQEKPDIENVDWLSEHVGEREKPFIGYQAAVGLYNAAKTLSSEVTYQVLKAIDNAVRNINKYDFKDPNQIEVLESAKAELSFSKLIVSPQEPVFKTENASFKTYKWYMLGADRCLPVARIGRDSSKGFGTGFLLRGSDLHESLEDQPVLITCAHVLSADPVERSLKPEEATVIFEALIKDEEFRDLEIIWSSPSTQFDATILRFAKADQERLISLTKNLKFYPIAKLLPLVEIESPQRIYVVGHPLGGTLQISFEDSILLDIQSPKIHYRTPTEGGSAGSPVFNQNWDLIGIHHAGSDTMPRLHNLPGTYSAKEGIWIQSIIESFKMWANNHQKF